MTKCALKSRYRKTIAGFLWVIINPVLTFSVQALIFKNILKVSVDSYYLFLLSGIIPWIFITSTLNMTASTFVSNRSVLVAFKLDPWIFILSQTLDNLITLIASFLILLLLNGELSAFAGLKIPLFFASVLLLSLATFFSCFFVATLHVFLRDTQFVLQFILNLAYFITPVFYPRELVPDNYQWLITFNPLFILIKPFQNIFWKYDTSIYFYDSLKAAGLIIFIIVLALWYWRSKKNDIYFNI